MRGLADGAGAAEPPPRPPCSISFGSVIISPWQPAPDCTDASRLLKGGETRLTWLPSQSRVRRVRQPGPAPRHSHARCCVGAACGDSEERLVSGSAVPRINSLSLAAVTLSSLMPRAHRRWTGCRLCGNCPQVTAWANIRRGCVVVASGT